MELSAFFQSVLEQDTAPIVLCDLDHTILYMNPAAKTRYAKRGGGALVGRSLLVCHTPEANARIQQVVDWFHADKGHNSVYTFYNEKENKDVYMVALRGGDGELMGYYEKHEYRDRETGGFYDLKEDGEGQA